MKQMTNQHNTSGDVIVRSETCSVPKPQFDAALASLLKSGPLPMADISPKKPKAKKHAKKRG